MIGAIVVAAVAIIIVVAVVYIIGAATIFVSVQSIFYDQIYMCIICV